MLESDNERVYVMPGYIRNFYHLIGLIARCHTANDVFGEILSHFSNSEMFTSAPTQSRITGAVMFSILTSDCKHNGAV